MFWQRVKSLPFLKVFTENISVFFLCLFVCYGGVMLNYAYRF